MTDDWWQKKLLDCREDVRIIDHEILRLIGKRMRVCLEIAEIKEYLGKPIFDPKQERRVLEDKTGIGEAIGLEEDFVRNLMNLMMQYSKKLQSNARKQKEKVEL